jgi:aminopeptidase YwaD
MAYGVWGIVLTLTIVTPTLAQTVKTSPAITAADIRERMNIIASDSLMGRRTGSEGAYKAARYISSEFARVGLRAADGSTKPVSFQQFFDFSEHALDTSRHEQTHAMNVVGFILGSDPNLRQEYVVIGAHYDHLGMGGAFALDSVHKIHYGADDNGSGTTGLLEIAEHLGKTHTKPKRSIVFVSFSGEEEGLFGSDHFVNQPLFPLEKVQAMINMDMIGRMNDSNTLIVQGIGTSPVFRSLVDSLNVPEEYGHHLTIAPLHLKYFQTGTGPSDHANFYKKNIPVLFFFTGFHEDYHKATDTKEKINAEGEARVAKYAERLLLSLANRPDKIAFTRPVGDTEQKAASFGVYVGGVPDYGYDGDGVAISEIREHSPAEAAGLKKDDVIIGFDDMTIKTIYDYTNALAKHKPDDVVQFKIKRASKEVTIPVKLGRRSSAH